MKKLLAAAAALALVGTSASAAIVGVAGPNSNFGAAAFVGTPTDALDDLTTNRAMQGFDEAQNVVLDANYAIDGGNLVAGTRVNSHMIFLNSSGNTLLTHKNVNWTFSGRIIGIMSDSGGFFEAASTAILGNQNVNYTVTGTGTGPAAPFPARGLENNAGCAAGGTNDGYTLVNAYTLCVGMAVTEPGDWIRVVTAVPVPASLPLMLGAFAGLGLLARRRKAA